MAIQPLCFLQRCPIYHGLGSYKTWANINPHSIVTSRSRFLEQKPYSSIRARYERAYDEWRAIAQKFVNGAVSHVRDIGADLKEWCRFPAFPLSFCQQQTPWRNFGLLKANWSRFGQKQDLVSHSNANTDCIQTTSSLLPRDFGLGFLFEMYFLFIMHAMQNMNKHTSQKVEQKR